MTFVIVQIKSLASSATRRKTFESKISLIILNNAAQTEPTQSKWIPIRRLCVLLQWYM